MVRSTREVVESHLEHRLAGRLDEDLAENYHEDVVLLSAEGVNRGHDGVRRLADVLSSYAPNPSFRIKALHVEGRFALEEWSATDGDQHLHDGADTFVVTDGRIQCQTIHFSVTDRPSEPGAD